MELETVLTTFAEEVRERRQQAGLTLEQLAQRADLSVAHLSRLESGDRQPSIASLLALSRALGVPISTLLGERSREREPAVGVYTGTEAPHEVNGLLVAACSGFPGSSGLDALHITIEPDRIPPRPASHRGEEWVYVLRGRLRLEFDDQVHLLGPGASAHFDAMQPHRLGALEASTEVLVVAAESPSEAGNRPLFTSSITAH